MAHLSRGAVPPKDDLVLRIAWFERGHKLDVHLGEAGGSGTGDRPQGVACGVQVRPV